MSTSRLGRGFADLPIEEQVRVLRDQVLVQELLIKLLLTKRGLRSRKSLRRTNQLPVNR